MIKSYLIAGCLLLLGILSSLFISKRKQHNKDIDKVNEVVKSELNKISNKVVSINANIDGKPPGDAAKQLRDYWRRD